MSPATQRQAEPAASLEDQLARHAFFTGLAADKVGFLAQCARQRRLATGQVLIRQGEAASSFFLVRSGRITREVPSISGAPLVMHSVGRDELLGWSWLVPPYRWSLLARAQQPTEVIEFDAGPIRELCAADPVFGYEFVIRFSQLMSDRLTRARQKMMDEWSPPGFG